MRGQTIHLNSARQRSIAHWIIDNAPHGACVNVREASRTISQNEKMWAMLSDLSRSKPEGLCMTTDLWKGSVMNACGHEVQFCHGLEGGQPFPVGFRSSKLTKAQMSDLIEWIYGYGARHGVAWSEPAKEDAA